MGKSVPRVTVWHHSAEPRDAKTMTVGTDLPICTSHSYQILTFHDFRKRCFFNLLNPTWCLSFFKFQRYSFLYTSF